MLNRKLVDISTGAIKRLIISMPPRHGKSSCVSQYFPAWYLGTFPDRRAILASYEADFAASWGRKVRDLLEEHGSEFFGVSLRRDSSSADRWDLADHLGGMNTAGVGGPLTGKGADILIIDDPIKNAQEANSPTIRERHKDWWQSTAYTRLEPGGAALVMCCMTGDTSVLMATGDEKPLRDIRPGDRVATYESGKVSVSTVRNWIKNGPDLVYEIRMKSGIIAKANARHPFLVEEGGETKWRRTDTLKKGSVIVRVIGANGRVSHAPQKGVTRQSVAKECAHRTTESIDGNPDFGHLRSILGLGVKRICDAATGLASRNMTGSWLSKAAFVPSASSLPPQRTHARTINFTSIIATIAKRLGGFSATTVTLPSVTERLRKPSSPPLSTYEITRDTVVEVVASGIEDVFDVEIERTANFIADGLVSHNTRWHEDDLPGWLMAEAKGGGDQWDVLNLPALAVENDPLGRQPGEALWPERYPAERLVEIRKALGEYWFSALYQGRPTPRSGGMFQREWMGIVEVAPVASNRVRFWDMASSPKGDYTVGVKMARTTAGVFHVEDVVRGRWTPHERDAVILQTAQLDGKATQIWIEQEPGSAGVSVIAVMVRMLAGYVIRGERATGDKSTRAGPMAAQCEAGNVKLVAGAWNRDYIEELTLFPFGQHDDCVDASSGAFNKLATQVHTWGLF